MLNDRGMGLIQPQMLAITRHLWFFFNRLVKGKIYTRNRVFFPIKLIGVSGENVPTIQSPIFIAGCSISNHPYPSSFWGTLILGNLQVLHIVLPLIFPSYEIDMSH